ncbi:hypothetical protein U9M48_034461 [Paspalum notatum var. saurae]|uniref:TTF-type domain-containing protein n=1 Tax=Paspalum notatum var. saurae TaxID=547442 RepID=A0AAQ3UA21_PASNO
MRKHGLKWQKMRTSNFMARWLKRKAPDDVNNAGNSHQQAANVTTATPEDINFEEEIQFDPGKRKEMRAYHPNLRESIRRKYLVNGPCQPRTLDFPLSRIGERNRRFNPAWFDEFGNWLEYSESTDRAYCFTCFLFRDPTKKEAGYKSFVIDGWNCWNNKDRLKEHVGDVGSLHNVALKKCDDLLQREQHVDVALHRQLDTSKNAYFVRLNGAIDTARLLLKQGLAFRGHNESKKSLNKGNYRELFNCLAEHDAALGKAMTIDAVDNSLLVSSDIQKDIVKCFADEILHSILEEIGHGVFCLLVDESRDVSCKEQMAVVLRYVDNHGLVKESFVGLVHVKETTSSNLKSCIDSLFAKFKLSLKQVRGQGYDGASNMRGEFNGLQSLIMRENSSAYYVHCFAHQLQLVVVAVARKHTGIAEFFSKISTLLNVVGGSSKRRDMIRDINMTEVSKALGCGLLKTGTGLNQEQCLQRPGDTRWSSHYKSLRSLVNLFQTIIKVLEFVEKEDKDGKARGVLVYFQSFEFVFYLHLMLTILTITNTLSMALQRKDQDIINAVNCVRSTKSHLDKVRRDGWEKLLGEVYAFCSKHDIFKLEMDEAYIDPTRPRKKTEITNKHHFQVDCFNEDFDVDKLMSLAELYPSDFDSNDLKDLNAELFLYINDVLEDDRFVNLQTIVELSQKMSRDAFQP